MSDSRHYEPLTDAELAKLKNLVVWPESTTVIHTDRVVRLIVTVEKWQQEASGLYEEVTQAHNRLHEDEAILAGNSARIDGLERECETLRQRAEKAERELVEVRAEAGTTFQKFCHVATLAGVYEQERDEAQGHATRLARTLDFIDRFHRSVLGEHLVPDDATPIDIFRSVQSALAATPEAIREDAKFLACRSEVKAFALAMEAQLKVNDHKSGWKNELAGALFEHLQEEVWELRGQYPLADKAATLWEAADVGNLAMMVADVCGALPTGDASDQTPK